jgi:hypothetical protein
MICLNGLLDMVISGLGSLNLSLTQTQKIQARPNPSQGCQMVCCDNKNNNFDTFWKTLERKLLIYFTVICYVM